MTFIVLIKFDLCCNSKFLIPESGNQDFGMGIHICFFEICSKGLFLLSLQASKI